MWRMFFLFRECKGPMAPLNGGESNIYWESFMVEEVFDRIEWFDVRVECAERLCRIIRRLKH